METYYIGADVHCNNTDLAVEYRGQVIRRYSVPTDIRTLRQVLDSVGGRKRMTFEEGPMAGWLYRNLRDRVEEVIVSDPRQNRLIAASGDDKSDPIDAGKLAMLLRGGFVKPVYHPDDEHRVELKRWVGLYHNRVQEATRQVNRLRAEARMYGLRVPAAVIAKAEKRSLWLSTLPNRDLAERIAVLCMGLDAVRRQTHAARRRMMKLAHGHSIIRYWSELPGIGDIRAITFFAYLDTPYRFKTKSKLFKYCGVGLVRETSGKDRNGRPRPGRLKLNWYCNKRLKNIVMGAAISAIRQKDNEFRRAYERMIGNGMLPGNARHAVARKLVTVMWGMWKNHSQWMPHLD